MGQSSSGSADIAAGQSSDPAERKYYFYRDLDVGVWIRCSSSDPAGFAVGQSSEPAEICCYSQDLVVLLALQASPQGSLLTLQKGIITT